MNGELDGLREELDAMLDAAHEIVGQATGTNERVNAAHDRLRVAYARAVETLAGVERPARKRPRA